VCGTWDCDDEGSRFRSFKVDTNKLGERWVPMGQRRLTPVREFGARSDAFAQIRGQTTGRSQEDDDKDEYDWEDDEEEKIGAMGGIEFINLIMLAMRV
jgi:hypothetical protein